MIINKIDTTLPLNNIRNIAEEKKDSDVSFSDFLKKAIYDVNDAKQYEAQLTRQLISGELENIHDLSIAKGVASVPPRPSCSRCCPLRPNVSAKCRQLVLGLRIYSAAAPNCVI